jgi:hypothetical protein
MSEEEMQFADPDWQPPEQRKSAPEQEPFHPQPFDAPREERPGWPSLPQGESNAAPDSIANAPFPREKIVTFAVAILGR